ncbi:hypothetical protein [Polaribacter sp. L3A8]|uniref:hypothetical protein n=1 Tax=Polaribacter sp. L3A8 TaxID=2686361 RepID=UPI00131DD009|nr:hypothetical protein [Polaribacter sp. L3A8]
MKEFVKQLPNKKLQSELENILTNKKPFQNFKFVIEKAENSGFTNLSKEQILAESKELI